MKKCSLLVSQNKKNSHFICGFYNLMQAYLYSNGVYVFVCDLSRTWRHDVQQCVTLSLHSNPALGNIHMLAKWENKYILLSSQCSITCGLLNHVPWVYACGVVLKWVTLFLAHSSGRPNWFLLLLLVLLAALVITMQSLSTDSNTCAIMNNTFSSSHDS